MRDFIHFNTVYRNLHKLIWTALPIVLFLEAVKFLGFELGLIGFVLWNVLFVTVAVFTVLKFTETFLFSPRDFVITLITLFTLISVAGIMIASPISSHFETTQEIGCIMNHIRDSSDLGYWQTCLFGYPARQLIVPAVPSLLFGTHVTSLNMGGMIYFVTGILLFASGLAVYFRENRFKDYIVAIFIISLSHFYYFNHFLFAFEQSIFPLSFALMLGGLFLLYHQRKSLYFISLAFVVAIFAVFSYTPSLALVGLFFVVLTYFLYLRHHPLNESLFIIGGIMGTMLLTIISFTYRLDMRISESSRSGQGIQQDIFNGISHVLLAQDGHAFVSPYLHVFFILVLISSLLFLFGKRMFVIAAWIVAVMIFAVAAKGYAYYGIDFRLHRSLVAVPVFLILAAFSLQKINVLSHIKEKYIVSFFTLIFLTGLYYQYTFLQSKWSGERHRHYEMIQWLNNLRREHPPINDSYQLYFTKDLEVKFVSINDQFQYYFPSVRSSILADTCHELSAADTSQPHLVFSTIHANQECQTYLHAQYSKIDEFQFLNEDTVSVFKPL